MQKSDESSTFIQTVLSALREKLREEAKEFVIREAAMKILKYVKLLKKDFKIISGGGLYIEDKVKDMTIPVYITFRYPEWIEIKTLLASGTELPPDLANECRVYEFLLRLANDFAELSFTVDSESNLYARQNILVGALSFDVFKEEYDAVVLSAVIFKKEILPRLKKCAKEYEEIRDAYETQIV